MIRIAALLTILLLVSVTQCQDRMRSVAWRQPLYVAVYPVAADSSAVTRAYVDGLDAQRFTAIDRFFAREAARYGLRLEDPVKTRLRPALGELPPARPADGSLAGTLWWSLELRYWAWRVSGRGPEDVRMFVLYHDPALSPTMPHSLGIEKGLIGVVNAFATPDMEGGNDVVIAHELLHTLGATDKYDPADDAPRFPDGYGDPRQSPLYPQRYAELMAGRRMISARAWEQPSGLDEVVIGPATAREIRWLKPGAPAPGLPSAEPADPPLTADPPSPRARAARADGADRSSRAPSATRG